MAFMPKYGQLARRRSPAPEQAPAPVEAPAPEQAPAPVEAPAPEAPADESSAITNGPEASDGASPQETQETQPVATKRHPLDHDGDGRPGGSKPKAKKADK